MATYANYKPSNIPWGGDIPSHWNVVRLKYRCSLKGRIGWNGLKSEEFKEDAYAYLVTGQDFVGKDIDWSKCYQIDQWRYDEDPFIQLQDGDLLITKDGTIGKVAQVVNLDKPACLNSGIFVLKQLKGAFTQEYLYWTLVSTQLLDFTNYNSGGSTTIQHLYQNVFENMPLIIPPLEEQKDITQYLDSHCGSIDKVIATQEQRITLLLELKQSIVTAAVTKGLNKNVHLRESNVDGLGLIPEGWEVVKTLYVLEMPITDGPHETPMLYDEGIPFISAEAISSGYINFDNMRGYISKEYYDLCCKKYVPRKNDIYMIKSGATTGRTAIVDTDEVFTIWSPLAVYRADNSKITPRFLLHLLRSDYVQKQVETNWSYGTQQNIGMRVLEHIKIPVPPIKEQHEIAEYLDNKCSSIDSAIAKAQQEIGLLKEYKQKVIADAVTGKIKVYNL
jgi:type I restriction enzyme S subunit